MPVFHLGSLMWLLPITVGAAFQLMSKCPWRREADFDFNLIYKTNLHFKKKEECNSETTCIRFCWAYTSVNVRK